MQLTRYYNNHESFELFNVIYRKDNEILVQNDETKKYSFGSIDDFYSLYWFPVNQSCLTKEECVDVLKRFIEIDNKYIKSLPSKIETIKMYEEMIRSLNHAC